MKFLLLGANGQVGRTFAEASELSARGELLLATRDGVLYDGSIVAEANLALPETLSPLLDRLRPQVIINAAAYTAVDRAEQEESLATRINGEAVGILGRWAAANGALVLHYSTDYVFDGQATEPYETHAITAPLNAYGRSKLAGEMALMSSGAQHLIFRTAWVYSAFGANFLRTMLRLGSERDELRVVNDQYGAPTTSRLIVRASIAALDHWVSTDAVQQSSLNGTYHLVSSGMTTWHDFALAIFQKAMERGLLARVPRVMAIDSAAFPTTAKRPAWSVLDNSGFSTRFGYSLPDWRIGLSEVIDDLYIKANR